MSLAMKLTSIAFVGVVAMLAFYFVAPKAQAASSNNNYSYSNRTVQHENDCYQEVDNNNDSVCDSCGDVIDVNYECDCPPIIKEIRVPKVNIIKYQKVINVPCPRPIVIRKVYVPKNVYVPQIVVNRYCPTTPTGCPTGCP